MVWRLRREEGDAAPTDGRGEHLYWTNVARFTVFRHRLQGVVSALGEEGIPVIVLKGALLAETLFESPGYRAMSDMDVLVRQQDFRAAVDCLDAHGWQSQHRDQKDGLLEMAGRRGVEQTWQTGEWTVLNEDGCALDIHWHLVPAVWLRPGYRVDMDGVWDEARPLDAEDLAGAFGLSDVHSLAYLCLHVAQHGLLSLRWLFDVDRFVRCCDDLSEWHWDDLIACVTEWEMRSAAFHALSFSKDLFDSPVPAPVLRRLDPGFAARARVAALIRPHHLLEDGSSAPGRRYPTLVKGALLDSGRDMGRVLRRVLYPAPLWRRTRYRSEASLGTHWRHVIEVVARGD
jgi:hypothetical protein